MKLFNLGIIKPQLIVSSYLNMTDADKIEVINFREKKYFS